MRRLHLHASVILQGSISINSFQRVILAPGGLFPPPFFLGLLVFWELGRDAAGFNNSAAFTHAPATFTFPATALRLGTEFPVLAPSVGARGPELDLDSASGCLQPWSLNSIFTKSLHPTVLVVVVVVVVIVVVVVVVMVVVVVVVVVVVAAVVIVVVVVVVVVLLLF